jgi:hypothetical protein
MPRHHRQPAPRPGTLTECGASLRLRRCYGRHSYLPAIHSFHRFIHSAGGVPQSINQRITDALGPNCG